MLVDWGSAVGLVRGDEPFVAAGKDVVGEFAPVDPPGIAVGAEAGEAAFDLLAEELVAGEVREVGLGGATVAGRHWLASGWGEAGGAWSALGHSILALPALIRAFFHKLF